MPTLTLFLLLKILQSIPTWKITRLVGVIRGGLSTKVKSKKKKKYPVDTFTGQKNAPHFALKKSVHTPGILSGIMYMMGCKNAQRQFAYFIMSVMSMVFASRPPSYLFSSVIKMRLKYRRLYTTYRLHVEGFLFEGGGGGGTRNRRMVHSKICARNANSSECASSPRRGGRHSFLPASCPPRIPIR